MGRMKAWTRPLRDGFAAALLIISPLALWGCASNSYVGIPFAAGTADPQLQSLARRAEAGDKHAQLELGIAYEEGRGVPVDLDRAEQLYRPAASDSGGPLYVYQPRVGDASARVARIENSERQEGLAEAGERLARLEAYVNYDSSDSRDATNASVPDVLTLWHTVVRLGSNSSAGDEDPGIGGVLAAAEQISWQVRESIHDCSEDTSNAVFPIAQAACEVRAGPFQVHHIWNEYLAPGGVMTRSPVLPGCLTVREAIAMLSDWTPIPYFPRRAIVPVPDSPIVYSEVHDLAPSFVYASPAGYFIYNNDYTSNGCLSNFYVFTHRVQAEQVN